MQHVNTMQGLSVTYHIALCNRGMKEDDDAWRVRIILCHVSYIHTLCIRVSVLKPDMVPQTLTTANQCPHRRRYIFAFLSTSGTPGASRDLGSQQAETKTLNESRHPLHKP